MFKRRSRCVRDTEGGLEAVPEGDERERANLQQPDPGAAGGTPGCLRVNGTHWAGLTPRCGGTLDGGWPYRPAGHP